MSSEGYLKRLAANSSYMDTAWISTNLDNGDDRDHAQALNTWHRAGLNTFVLSESMVAALLFTNSSKTPEPPPFNAFAITVPPGTLSDGKDDYEVIHYSAALHKTTREPMLYVAIQTVKEGALVRLRSLIRLDDYLSDPTTPWDSRSECLVAPLDTEIVRKTWKLFTGLCHWLHAHPREVRSGKRKQSFTQRYRANAPTWIEIGKTVRLGRALIQAAKQLDNPATRAEWKLASRHVVRGHFRTTYTGPGRTESRQLWIQPYWRGPEGEAAWAHVYKLAPN